jgi:hypothetical protein
LLTEIDAIGPHAKGWAAKSGIMPGGSKQLLLTADENVKLLSWASMIVTTNDSFVALQNIELPISGTVSLDTPAYDAGTERNNELCQFIPGPPCGSHLSRDPTPGEFIRLSAGPGIMGHGDLGPEFTWDARPASVTMERVELAH